MNSPLRPHILIMPRWYPHRYDPMPGLFVRYQAEALVPHCTVTVLYVHPDPDCPNDMETEYGIENGVQVIRVYYRPGAWPFQRWIRFYKAHANGLGMLDGAPPDLVHVHVLTREGVMGYVVAKRFRIPYVISEHWSRYFPGNDFFRGWFKKRITRFVVSHASAILPVSRKLMEAMISKGLRHSDYHVVPNVIDARFFIAGNGSAEPDKPTIVHVSCFDDRSKNISGLLEAAGELKKRGTGFLLRLVGNGPDLDRMKALAARLDLHEPEVVFAGMKVGEDLSAEYGNADFSVLSSRFETFGSVVIESLACGTPILATSTGIAPDIVSEENGILIPPGDQVALTIGLAQMLARYRDFDRVAVRRSVEGRFTPEKIASQLMDIYRSVTGMTNV